MIEKRPKNSVQRRLFILALLIVPLINFFVFYVYVNLDSIIMAFQTIENGETIFSLTNFEMLFKELGSDSSTALISLKNTCIFFVQGFITGICTGFIISYFLYKKIPCSKLFRVLLFLPGLLSSVVVTRIFSYFVGYGGPVTKIIEAITGQKDLLLLADSRYALKTLLGYNIWLGLAGNMVLYMGGMNRIPKEVLEYGKLDGVSWVRELFQIVLPLMWPTIVTLITVQFTGIFAASGPIFLFTQGKYETSTISYWLWTKVYDLPLNSPQLNYGSAIGLFFTLVALPIVFGVRWILGKVQAAVEY